MMTGRNLIASLHVSLNPIAMAIGSANRLVRRKRDRNSPSKSRIAEAVVYHLVQDVDQDWLAPSLDSSDIY
jgi:hypothetical protein